MLDFIQSHFMEVITHYKKMTMIVFIVSMLKLASSVIFPALTWYSNWSSRRQRIKLWMNIGYSREKAEAMIADDEKRMKRITKENSLWSSVRKMLKRIWRR